MAAERKAVSKHEVEANSEADPASEDVNNREQRAAGHLLLLLSCALLLWSV